MSAQPWIQSFSGKVVTLLDLKVEQVTLEDIPHVLSQKVRFTGHLREAGYSVAQHCVLGARAIAEPFKLAFLLHEVSEVYLPDIAGPIKSRIFVDYSDKRSPILDDALSWEELEAQHADIILEALGLSSIRPLLDSPEVREMDLRMLMTEKRDLMGPEPKPWGINVEPLDFRITEIWSPTRACVEFTSWLSWLREGTSR